MTDYERELLEWSAKALGHTLDFTIRGDAPAYYVNERGGHSPWNPLDDNNDAVQALAAMPSLWSLTLMFGIPTIEMNVAWGTGKGITSVQRAGQHDDRAKAIRRAITEALAEVGKRTV